LLDPSVHVVARWSTVMNPRRLRQARAADLGLGRVDRLKWAKEQRGCLALQVTLPEGRSAVLANLHTTAYPEAAAEIELEQALAFVDELSGASDISILVRID